jgi:glutamine synthetase
MPDRNELESWLREHEIRSVRLEATNHDGLPLGKHLSPAKFLSVASGGAQLADTAFGLDFSGDVAFGWDWGEWRGEVTDVTVVPDLDTLLADRCNPGLASVICDFVNVAGEPLPVCGRSMLRRLVGRLRDSFGLELRVAPELEFSIFEEPLDVVRERGYRRLTPLGGPSTITYLLTRSPDFTEFMSRAVERLDGLGVGWESWSSETAAGQAEINIGPTDPLAMADQVIRAKLALREAAAELGRTVTFMAMVDEHLGASMHVNFSLVGPGSENLFHSEAGPARAPALRHWIAGLITTMPGAMSFFSPTVNSFRRLIEIAGPPTTVTWAEANKSAALRTVTHSSSSARIEHRVPAMDSNPYLVLAAIIAGGMIGMEDELEPPEPFEEMAWGLAPDAAPRLPDSITRAADALAEDGRLAAVLGPDAVDYWLGTRRWEWLAFHRSGGDPDVVTESELARYFETV